MRISVRNKTKKIISLSNGTCIEPLGRKDVMFPDEVFSGDIYEGIGSGLSLYKEILDLSSKGLVSVSIVSRGGIPASDVMLVVDKYAKSDNLRVFNTIQGAVDRALDLLSKEVDSVDISICPNAYYEDISIDCSSYAFNKFKFLVINGNATLLFGDNNKTNSPAFYVNGVDANNQYNFILFVNNLVLGSPLEKTKKKDFTDLNKMLMGTFSNIVALGGGCVNNEDNETFLKISDSGLIYFLFCELDLPSDKCILNGSLGEVGFQCCSILQPGSQPGGYVLTFDEGYESWVGTHFINTAVGGRIKIKSNPQKVSFHSCKIFPYQVVVDIEGGSWRDCVWGGSVNGDDVPGMGLEMSASRDIVELVSEGTVTEEGNTEIILGDLGVYGNSVCKFLTGVFVRITATETGTPGSYVKVVSGADAEGVNGLCAYTQASGVPMVVEGLISLWNNIDKVCADSIKIYWAPDTSITYKVEITGYTWGVW